jgi:hypothetical protein
VWVGGSAKYNRIYLKRKLAMTHLQQIRKKLFLLVFVPVLVLITITVPGPALSETQNPEPVFDAARGGNRAFQRLLRDTYLGHAAELPDPSEPVFVLQQYLEIQKHNNLDRKALDKRVNDWRKLARQYAHLGLAKTYRDRAAFAGQADLHRAVDSFLRASEIGRGQGRLLFTRQLSELMVQLNDREGLDDAFQTMLKANKADTRPGEQYSVLVDYADGLAALQDERAWGYFEQAIALQPESIEAINRYARRLLEAGKAEEVLRVLEAHLTRQERVRFVRPAFLRRQALKALGRDTASADEEIAEIRERQGKAGIYVPEKDTGDPLGNVVESFAHSTSSDDCRSATYAQSQHCDSSGTCLYSYVINLAEVMYNEARGESIGSQDAVGWTVRDRAFQGVSCDAYIGGVNYTSCRTNLPCGDPSRCAVSRYYCCVIHGNTTTVGAAHSQFNDAHVTLQTLIDSGQFYEAQLVWWGAVPDPTTGFAPAGVSGCTVGCGPENYCTGGVNYDSPSPNGPMEYLGYNYCAQRQECKTYKGNVCGSNTRATSCSSGGSGDNYFWNRRN